MKITVAVSSYIPYRLVDQPPLIRSIILLLPFNSDDLSNCAGELWKPEAALATEHFPAGASVSDQLTSVLGVRMGRRAPALPQ
jgi:hypothetical protein